jgi:hypothetical protein
MLQTLECLISNLCVGAYLWYKLEQKLNHCCTSGLTFGINYET